MQNTHSCQLQTLGFVKNYQPDSNSNNIINHTLYHKYASSQNYYYTREINEILSKQRTSSVILFQDYLHYDDEDEYLRRFYLQEVYANKMKLLKEFYKYHKDLPRFTLTQKILQTLNYYYDKRRKLDYYRIQRQIEFENKQNPQLPQKGIVGDKPMESESTPRSASSSTSNANANIENILKDITRQESKQQIEISKITQIQEEQQSEIIKIINMISTPQIKNYQVFKKSKNNFKKQLKLDELGLSLSSRIQQNPQEAKMPLSARYPSYSLSRVNYKHQSLSKEKTADTHLIKDNLLQLFNKCPTTKKMKVENKSSSRNIQLDQKKLIPEIKQLELKIIKSLQEIEKNKNTQKIVSLDSKALHQILSKFSKPQSQRHIQQVDSFKSTSNQSIKITNSKIAMQKAYTPRNKFMHSKPNETNQQHPKKSIEKKQQQLVKALDLKKLMVYKSEKSAKTERVKKNVPALNLNAVQINNQSSLTSRNQSGNPSFIQLLTPKPQTSRSKVNNLIHWQVKAIQAAQRDYKLQLKTQQMKIEQLI
ncbi:unnamed protein product (macronuclear) [Paramecium tetraurelia]|uniref:Uncharacterized protein n=1 Tax=Paramecium tetraurelia TaxID=5888 RepID=A0CIW6_PARTE|nr:uncharacterized protein GSPATT00007868001 [Paramecium tetraurelia]CAK70733.1 unnamed protein product [Paramecium tetraurelia]|eukprot:XP_001438130.1 hypothetical protein (macronuclear) [Paramecium tetraurelia strain d4-2]